MTRLANFATANLLVIILLIGPISSLLLFSSGPSIGISKPNSLRRCSTQDDYENFQDENTSEDVVVRKKHGRKFVEYRPKDNRDRLPYDVYISSPPWSKVGRFALPPCTGCGDMIHHNSNSYIIRRVSCHYRYQGGSYKMYRKEAHAVELMRAATERIVERMVANADTFSNSGDFLTNI